MYLQSSGKNLANQLVNLDIKAAYIKVRNFSVLDILFDGVCSVDAPMRKLA